MGHPTVYPTGATLYKPEKAYSGYTIFQAYGLGAMLIDMNGKAVRLWEGLQGFPNKIFPGGYVLGSKGQRSGKYGMQDQIDLVQLDWDGNEVWRFDQWEYIEDPETEPKWMARQHHDFQREGSPTGYFAPNLAPNPKGGSTLVLCHKNVVNPQISDKVLLDDIFVEVDWEGNILWQWSANEHFEELGFGEEAKNVLFRDPNMRSAGGGMGDWLHINSMSTIGPNQWYDAGDERFHPDNIIWDAREANIIAITSKETGRIVWKLGPDYHTPEVKHLGNIIGQHHAHIIPRGLPGEGNLLVFDNGGWAGYGASNPSSRYGVKNAWRDFSRILEINPVTLQIEWRYTAEEAGYGTPYDSSRFYSPYISSVQRLPNGNTLIDQGSDGRLFEVTRDFEIVWEYISPYRKEIPKINNMVYRAYRVPYEWVPQLEKPEECEIAAIDVTDFRVPGSAPKAVESVVKIDGIIKTYGDADAFCVAGTEETLKQQKIFTVNKEIFRPLDAKCFDETLRTSNHLSLVLFGAERCFHCKATMPLLKKAAGDYVSEGKMDLYYLDVDENLEITDRYGIRGIPNIIVFQKEAIVANRTGRSSYEELKKFLDELIGGQ